MCPDFDEAGWLAFWESYPRHEAKKDAHKAWNKLKPSPELQEEILQSIADQKQGRKWRDGFVCLPATFLRGERWLDEVEVAPITDQERRQAESFRRNVWRMRCEHEEPCAGYAMCIERIARGER